MILIVTNKIDPTADLVITELHKRDVAFVRFNTEEFPTRVQCAISIETSLVDGYLDFGSNRRVPISEITSVYYRRPNQFQLDDRLSIEEAKTFATGECRATIGGLWMSLPCLWLNHPHHIHASEFKIYQLRIANELGFRTPKTLITNDPKLAREFYNSCNAEIIAKSLHTGTIEYEDDVLLVYTTRITNAHFDFIESVKYAPCLFQEYIQKNIEIRVTVVGNQAFAAEIHSQKSNKTKDDWRRYDFANTPHLPHILPVEIEQRCIKFVKSLNLNFGAIDLVLTPDGEYVFLEINPNGQWGWIEDLTKLPICNAIVDLLVQGGTFGQLHH